DQRVLHIPIPHPRATAPGRPFDTSASPLPHTDSRQTAPLLSPVASDSPVLIPPPRYTTPPPCPPAPPVVPRPIHTPACSRSAARWVEYDHLRRRHNPALLPQSLLLLVRIGSLAAHEEGSEILGVGVRPAVL